MAKIAPPIYNKRFFTPMIKVNTNYHGFLTTNTWPACTWCSCAFYRMHSRIFLEPKLFILTRCLAVGKRTRTDYYETRLLNFFFANLTKFNFLSNLKCPNVTRYGKYIWEVVIIMSETAFEPPKKLNLIANIFLQISTENAWRIFHPQQCWKLLLRYQHGEYC